MYWPTGSHTSMVSQKETKDINFVQRWVRGTEERAASHEHGFSLGRFSQGFSLGCFSQVVKVKSLPGELPSSYAHALLVLALLMIAIDAGDGSLFSIPNDERGAKDDFSRG
ncbi:hypothetical protein BHM03_00000235 [Ensete ventricosum]|nr:hypothetical protein BHM03_00000235 [Ensete ventricosum]